MNKIRQDRSGITLVELSVVAWAIDLGILLGGNYI